MPVKTILVIDNDQNIRHVAREFLQDEGYTVHAVHDVGAGLAVLHDRRVDLILLDQSTGLIEDDVFIQSARRLSSPRLPIELWTAWPNPAERALAMDADGSLEKPVSLDGLLDCVRHLIGAP